MATTCSGPRASAAMGAARLRALRQRRPRSSHGSVRDEALLDLALVGAEALFAPAGAVQSRQVERLQVEVDDEEVLLEGRAVGDELAVLVEDHAVAVEDELVLAADHVDVADVDGVVGGARGDHALAEGALALVIGRAVDVG